jgi:hypothetical protein
MVTERAVLRATRRNAGWLLAAGILMAGCGVRVGGGARQPTVRLGAGGRALPEFVAGAFPTRGSGWLLGNSPDALGAPRAEVWHTDTAASRWRVQWQGPGTAVAISATDPRHAWALIGCEAATRGHGCRSDLIGTTDGGARWRRLSWLPPEANLVQFSTASLGIATADTSCPSIPSPSRCPGQVLVSDDGGARWSTVLRSPDPLYATVDPTGRLWAAQVLPGFGGNPAPRHPEIRFLSSTDGGHSWRALGEIARFEVLGASTVVHLAAGAEGLEWAGVFDPEDCAMHGCGTAALYHSPDGGWSWKAADLYREFSEQCGPDGMVFSRAPDGTVWAATGQNGGACPPPFGMPYRHDHSGWRQLPPWQLAGIGSLAAVDGKVAYAISGEVVARSDDGGQHWTQLLPALAPTGQLDALDQHTALGAGDTVDAGAVLRTTDWGLRWQQLAELPGIITQLDFPSPSDGVALTLQVDRLGRAHWQLWRSRDGGRSWHSQGGRLGSPIASGDLWGPWVSSDGSGLLLSVAGAIDWQGPASGGVAPVRMWTTADWGAHWERGSLLPVGSDTLGQASFIPTGARQWVGWAIHATISAAGWRIEAVTHAGRTITPVPHSPSVQGVQLVSRTTGFAWTFEPKPYPASPVLVLHRTTDAGRHWQQVPILAPATQADGPATQPFVDFTDPEHGWLLIGTTSWHSSDGGRSWRRG